MGADDKSGDDAGGDVVSITSYQPKTDKTECVCECVTCFGVVFMIRGDGLVVCLKCGQHQPNITVIIDGPEVV